MCDIIVYIFCWLFSVQNHIEDIVGILFPICREKGHHISSVSFALGALLGALTRFFKEHCLRLPGLLDVLLHLPVLDRIVGLLKVLFFTKNFFGQSYFVI